MPKTIGILGKKVGMTRVYSEMGESTPVTVIEAGPCKILQVKSEIKDGYNAIQVGFSQKKSSRVNKPMAGHFQKAGSDGFYHIREFRVPNPDVFKAGEDVTLDSIFKIGDIVDVQGLSKGRGFQGVMKRHGFKGGGDSHGSNFHRAPGSIGCSAWPSRVVKGKKMPGRMGNTTVIKKSVKVIDIRPDENIIILKGPVPGSKNGLLKIYSR
jgi:large subunit ribosomal protein L3